MHHHYEDIRSRISEPTLWWDENAVPRYCKFSPDQAANIYADEVVLLEIECQSCHAAFHVCISQNHGWALAEKMMRLPKEEAKKVKMEDVLFLADQIDSLHYGDPPNVGCCGSGAVMNSVPIRVVEFWERHRKEQRDWVRRPDLEQTIYRAELWSDE